MLGTDDKRVLHYYMVWLKLKLDDLSRAMLPTYYVQIQQKQKELDSALQEGDKSAESKCRQELKELDCRLVDASFGIEHLFREASQIYEAELAQN